MSSEDRAYQNNLATLRANSGQQEMSAEERAYKANIERVKAQQQNPYQKPAQNPYPQAAQNTQS